LQLEVPPCREDRMPTPSDGRLLGAWKEEHTRHRRKGAHASGSGRQRGGPQSLEAGVRPLHRNFDLSIRENA